MPMKVGLDRRSFLQTTAAGLITAQLAMPRFAAAAAAGLPSIRQIKAGVLDIGYYETGPTDGPAALLMHGFPYSIDSYSEVAPMLAALGCRVILPYLRSHGSTASWTRRLLARGSRGHRRRCDCNALDIRRAVLAGYDWDGRSACITAALWPQRCAGLVSVNSYLIQDIARASQPIAARSNQVCHDRPASGVGPCAQAQCGARGGRHDVAILRGRTGRTPPAPACASAERGVSGTACSATVHTEIGRQATPVGDCGVGGQNRPARSGRSAKRGLRRRLSRLLVRVPTRAQSA